MAENDYYNVLGVSRGASAAEIKKAYKRLSRENHPDAKPNDKEAAERFKRVQEAYSILSDEEKRRMYDQFGTAAFGAGRAGAGRGGGAPFNWGGGSGGASPVDLENLFGSQIDLGDFFSNAFGGGGGRGRPQPPARGRDIEVEVEIPFHIAAEGGNYSLRLPHDRSGKRTTVKIPAGVEAGAVIRLAGEGEEGAAGGPKGDVLLRLRVGSHPYFRREGADLYVDVPVTPWEAALGAKIDVPTLSEGKVSMKIPAGTSTGAKLRLRGKGVVRPKTGDRGDEYAVIKIVIPKPLSEEAKGLFEKLASLNLPSPREGAW